MRLGIVSFSFQSSAVDAFRLVDRAVGAGLDYVELPVEGLAGTEDLSRLRAYADDQHIGLLASTGYVEPERLRRCLRLANTIGSPVLRVVATDTNCGNRRLKGPRWREEFDAVIAMLQDARPVAEDLGVTVAVENHQDGTSWEFVELCERVGGDFIGITLDVGNAFGVVEEPLAHARRLAPWVRNVQLKDYQLYLSPVGYRMVTCAVGSGQIDIPPILGLFADRPDLPVGIEMGARVGRHIEFLAPGWWDHYPPREPADILDALRAAFAGARPSTDEWRCPRELGASASVQIAHEIEQFEASAAYLRFLDGRTLSPGGTPAPLRCLPAEAHRRHAH